MLHVLLGGALVLGALTPAKVDNVQSNGSPGAQPPHVIYVDTFSVSEAASSAEDDGGGRPHLFGGGGIFGRRHEQTQDDLVAELPGLLQQALIHSLSENIAHATYGDDNTTNRPDCWVIRGQFTVIDQGSRAMQAGVGFGAGQSQVQVTAQVYSVRHPNNPFLVFDSTGASGHMPGAVVMMNPYVAAAKFVMSKKEPKKETKKIAAAIAKEIGKFMTAQGIPTLEQMQGN